MAARNACLGFLVSSLLACGSSPGAPSSAQEEAFTSSAASSLAALVSSAAVTVPSLGTAANYAVLGGAGVTCTASTVTGDAGSLLTVTRTPTCSISGAIHQGDAAANTAYNDFVDAYLKLAAMTCPAANNLTGQPLGGMKLPPGVYCFATTADLTTGTLTLDGPADGVWVFQVGTAITTGTSSVVMSGGGQACNVYWQLGTAATIGTGSAFLGNVLAGSAITFTGANSSLGGRALAKTAVTMTGTTITACSATSGGGGGGGTPGTCRKDFVTGGGFIKGGRSEARDTFSVAGGIKRGAFRGHLDFEDHGRSGVKVKGTGVTAYLMVDATTRHIEGTAKVNGRSGYTYQVDVSDKGEGKNDTFALVLSNGYGASGTLGGGNIELHQGLAHGKSCGTGGGDDGDDDEDDDEDDGDGDGGHGGDGGGHGGERGHGRD